MRELFSDHIDTLLERYESALSHNEGIDALLIFSGSEHLYYGDDQIKPFHAYGHFCTWLPIDRPNQALLIEPGRRPVYFQVVPPDYWYDQTIQNADWWSARFDIVTLEQPSDLESRIGGMSNLGFIGEDKALARSLGIPNEYINRDSLLHRLDYGRACKTAYEISQIIAANRSALSGHDAARETFLDGGSELDIHLAYLNACDCIERELPYESIVALNEKAAVLHYQHKRRNRSNGGQDKSQVLLIDAGCRVNNYCSDITRTWTRAPGHSVFEELLSGMQELQSRLVDFVKPGLDYLELHEAAMSGVAELAIECGLFHGSPEQAQELGNVFMPHGVGHLLGVQVHDVGGHLGNEQGETCPPPAAYPALRTTRRMTSGMVFTIEPGFYFIPLLLEAQRGAPQAELFNWKLIEELMPFGGMRIEDNVPGHRRGTH